MEYHHSYFLAIGFVTALAGLLGQFFLTGLESFRVAEAATVIGALILGYRTGRCDEKACSW